MVKVKIICEDITGILAKITEFLLKEKIELKCINSHTNKSKVIFDVGIEIEDKSKLKNLSDKLLNINGVIEINRSADS